MGCGRSIAELLLGITNLIYFLAGAAVLSFGIIALVDSSLLVDILQYIPKIDELSAVLELEGISFGTAVYLTTMGGVIVAVFILGCGGAFKKNKCITTIYGLITLTLMLCNIAVIMFCVIDPYIIQPNVEESMNKTLVNFEPVSISSGVISLPNLTSPDAWITMQFEEACCGINGPDDYKYIDWKNDFPDIHVTDAVVPPSCCMQKVQYQVANSTAQFIQLNDCMMNANGRYEYTNSRGCIDYMMAEITRYNFILVCTAAALDGLQAIVTALSLYVTSHQTKGVGAAV